MLAVWGEMRDGDAVLVDTSKLLSSTDGNWSSHIVNNTTTGIVDQIIEDVSKCQNNQSPVQQKYAMAAVTVKQI